MGVNFDKDGDINLILAETPAWDHSQGRSSASEALLYTIGSLRRAHLELERRPNENGEESMLALARLLERFQSVFPSR